MSRKPYVQDKPPQCYDDYFPESLRDYRYEKYLSIDKYNTKQDIVRPVYNEHLQSQFHPPNKTEICWKDTLPDPNSICFLIEAINSSLNSVGCYGFNRRGKLVTSLTTIDPKIASSIEVNKSHSLFARVIIDPNSSPGQSDLLRIISEGIWPVIETNEVIRSFTFSYSGGGILNGERPIYSECGWDFFVGQPSYAVIIVSGDGVSPTYVYTAEAWVDGEKVFSRVIEKEFDPLNQWGISSIPFGNPSMQILPNGDYVFFFIDQEEFFVVTKEGTNKVGNTSLIEGSGWRFYMCEIGGAGNYIIPPSVGYAMWPNTVGGLVTNLANIYK